MHDNHRSRGIHFPSAIICVLGGLACLTVTSCGYRPRNPVRSDTELGREWPESPRQPAAFREASYGVLRDSMPVTEGAEYVNDDELCMNCHKAYTESMQQNVHRGIQEGGQHACEACHGPASAHLMTRGKEPGRLWNFRTMRPAQAAEVCMKCHEENACAPGAKWRTSVHAHNNLTCVSCHRGHYNVPPGTPATTEPGDVSAQLRAGTDRARQLPGARVHPYLRWLPDRTKWVRSLPTSATAAMARNKTCRKSPAHIRFVVPTVSIAQLATTLMERSWKARGSSCA